MSKQQMQIKLMVKKEYDLAAEFLRTDLELNALIIEDLTEEHMMVYGGYLNTHLNAILMIYPEKIYYYSPDINFPLGEFALIIRETGIRKIVGKKNWSKSLNVTFKWILKVIRLCSDMKEAKIFRQARVLK
ncbi:hypothetical protein MGI18_15755 [Bacillus sp. OVS6]|nr:hypothetical protein MGI18_15755 [Bacillus sp. OVS6]